MTTILSEPFDNLTAWTNTGALIKTGRNGFGASVASGTQIAYTIPAPSESDTLTVGFAWRTDAVPASSSSIAGLASDAGATRHSTLLVASDGSIKITRGALGGTVIATSAAAVVTGGVWYYLEVQAKLHDSTGFATVRLNGTVIASAPTVDTKNVGSKTVYDRLILPGPVVGRVSTYDDLYLKTGAGETFNGDTVIDTSTPCVELLYDPLDDASSFTTVSGTPTFAAGRTGNAMTIAGSTAYVQYTIPPANESYMVTFGVAYKMAGALINATEIVRLYSDAGATLHNRVHVNTTSGVINATRGASTSIGSGGALALNTWYYIEIQAILHDNAGQIIVRVNGTPIISATDIDTKNGGTKAVYDTVRLMNVDATNTGSWDDLYLLTGTTCSFLGDQVITTGTTVNVWNGSAFVAAPVKVWSGSAFVDATAVKVWNGSAFVDAT